MFLISLPCPSNDALNAYLSFLPIGVKPFPVCSVNSSFIPLTSPSPFKSPNETSLISLYEASSLKSIVLFKTILTSFPNYPKFDICDSFTKSSIFSIIKLSVVSLFSNFIIGNSLFIFSVSLVK